MIERCGDRQRKCDGLEIWPLHFFVESLPIMLQVALLFLAPGLFRYIWSINPSVACTLLSLTDLGVVVYIAIVITGTSSYARPFQIPISTALRGSWTKVRHRIISFINPKRLRRKSPPTIPLANIRQTNTNSAGCVPWIFRNIADPEAPVSAIRLAREIR